MEHPVTPSGRASTGGLFYHLGAKTVKSLKAGLLSTLRDDGTCQAVLEDRSGCDTVQSVISALR